MIRKEAAIACAHSIIDPLRINPDLVPLVAAMIESAVKMDELDQQLEQLNPERCRREGVI